MVSKGRLGWSRSSALWVHNTEHQLNRHSRHSTESAAVFVQGKFPVCVNTRTHIKSDQANALPAKATHPLLSYTAPLCTNTYTPHTPAAACAAGRPWAHSPRLHSPLARSAGCAPGWPWRHELRPYVGL
eukprot:1158141-Pelagomonas_calceolata.AAC.1